MRNTILFKQLTWRSGAVMVLLAVAFFISLYLPATGNAVILPGSAVDITTLVESEGASPNTGALYVIPVRVLERRFAPYDISPLNANPIMVFIGRTYPGALVAPLSTYMDPSLDTAGTRRDEYLGTLHTQTVPAEVAFSLLGRAYNTSASGARVLGVDPSGPADGLLRVGDVIRSIDGTHTRGTDDLVRALHDRDDDLVALRVHRGSDEFSLEVRLLDGRLGIAVEPADPLLIYDGGSIRVSDLRGTSGDLGIALEVYSRVSGEDLTRGRSVAAVGTVMPSGAVRSVGAVELKLAAAERAGVDLMLVPKKDASRLPSSSVEVVGVDSVASAVAVLR